MLVELAYNSPLHDLRRPEDDQGDGHTLYWMATRLGDNVGRRLGAKYAAAVKICLHGGLGASCDLKQRSAEAIFQRGGAKANEVRGSCNDMSSKHT